jgi:predicted DNA-binding protein (UPF0278 family)
MMKEYIKYPEDKLYLRVSNLLHILREYTIKVSNLEAYAYLTTIKERFGRGEAFIKITEAHILSPNFLNQNCFKETDKENLKSIIREYKLNQLV